MKRLAAAALATFVLASCQDRGEPFSPELVLPPSAAEADVFDARAEDGNSSFAFRPPLAPLLDLEGVPDPTLVTRVEVCELNAVDDTCAATVWTSLEPVPVVDGHYQVDWPLDASYPPLESGEGAPYYRVRVLVQDLAIGHLDLTFADNQSARKKGGADDDLVIVGTNRTLPVSYALSEGALAEELGCTVGGSVIDCDAALLEDESQTISVFANGRLAAQAEFDPPLPVGPDGEPIFFLLEHIDALTLPPGDGFPFFARATLYDSEGNLLEDWSVDVDRFILCQAEGIDLASALHAFLEIRRHDDGQTTLVPSDPNTPECSLTQSTAQRSGPAPSWDQRVRSGLTRLAGAFVPRPLRALHGGLNTTGMLCCSEFDAVLVDEVAPEDTDYRSGWDWFSAETENEGSDPAPFFAGSYPYSGCPDLSVQGGTGGSLVWPLDSDLILTKSFQVPAEGVTGIKIWVGIDNDIKVFLNDTDITETFVFHDASGVGRTSGINSEGFLTHDQCAAPDDFSFDPGDVVELGNVNTLEIIARDRGGIGFFDARVELVEEPIIQ